MAAHRPRYHRRLPRSLRSQLTACPWQRGSSRSNAPRKYRVINDLWRRPEKPHIRPVRHFHGLARPMVPPAELGGPILSVSVARHYTWADPPARPGPRAGSRRPYRQFLAANRRSDGCRWDIVLAPGPAKTLEKRIHYRDDHERDESSANQAAYDGARHGRLRLAARRISALQELLNGSSGPCLAITYWNSQSLFAAVKWLSGPECLSACVRQHAQAGSRAVFENEFPDRA